MKITAIVALVLVSIYTSSRAATLDMPSIPNDNKETIEVQATLNQRSYLPDHVLQLAKTIAPPSSVIISLPHKRKTAATTPYGEFATADFFGFAISQIEKSLADQGLLVLSHHRLATLAGNKSIANANGSGRQTLQAAGSQDIQADYVLQISHFAIEKTQKVASNLQDIPKVREFFRNRPQAKAALLNGDHKLPCAVDNAVLAAKLVRVESGEIVWMGKHQLNETSLSPRQVWVEIGSQTQVANADNIARFIREHQQNPPSATVQIPDFTYSHHLIAPTVADSSCSNPQNDISGRFSLAKQVAKELLGSIKY